MKQHSIFRPLLACLVALSAASAADEAGTEFFEKRIRPVLVEHCVECHGPEKSKGGLRLDSREALRTSGDSGGAIVPGKPEESLLITALHGLDKDLRMPPPKKDGTERKLPASVIADFEAWVKMGAPDPRTESAGAAIKTQIDFAAAREMWAFRKPALTAVPEVRDAAWARSSIDRFILARLEARNLRPAPAAEKRTLLRRVTFDLTGLPPTSEEIRAFLGDKSPDAFSKVVDRLLASPRYGERWARHWLDVVRYTDHFDSRVLAGDARKMDCSEAWRYRDWVVNAFNRDLPYDQFIQHQVAGDLLAQREWDPEKIVATGVYAIGNWGGGDADKEKLLTDIADDQVDLTGRAFLGLTIACARCHDHKFDPISTEDYYGLAGIFFSSHILPNPGPKTNGPEMLRIPLLTDAERAKRDAAQRRLDEIDAELARGLQPLTEVKRDLFGKAGLVGWTPKATDNPSLVINTTAAEAAFLSIKLPAGAVMLHPAPKVAASAAWRSPVDGRVRISARVRDADPTCGDGIAWAVRKGGTVLASGEIGNGGSAECPEQEVAVVRGELLQLKISPRAEYTCDATQVEFTIRSTEAGGRVWDLREMLAGGGAQGHENTWWICAGDGDRLNADALEFAALRREREELAATLAQPAPEAHGLQEGGCPQSAHAGTRDVRVHVRGRYDRLGPVVPRRFPQVLAGDAQAPITEGSGRLALAQWLASADNPLTARVIVNRVWHHHFGSGLVRTPNNFGKLGEAPTHPELLDWLTHEFVRSGWSLKALHRAILLSSAWQQSSVPDAETLRADPDNLLFGRMNRRRLESEGIRDSLLVVAGRLDETRGGPAYADIATPRRTLYLRTIRSDRAGYQSLFDAADPTGIVEKRIDSTVAPQALFLMNHPFALAQAQALAKRAEREAGETAARVQWLYEQLFSRHPTPEEVQLWQKALAEGVTWEQACHALLCANEFIYID